MNVTPISQSGMSGFSHFQFPISERLCFSYSVFVLEILAFLFNHRTCRSDFYFLFFLIVIACFALVYWFVVLASCSRLETGVYGFGKEVKLAWNAVGVKRWRKITSM